MTRSFLAALLLAVSACSAGSALAAPARAASFDGTWRVRLVTMTGTCNASYSYTIAVRNGQVRPVGSGADAISVSGGIARDGRVALGIQHSIARADATGRLRKTAGGGTWTLPLLGCSGRWTAQRRTIRA